MSVSPSISPSCGRHHRLCLRLMWCMYCFALGIADPFPGFAVGGTAMPLNAKRAGVGRQRNLLVPRRRRADCGVFRWPMRSCCRRSTPASSRCCSASSFARGVRVLPLSRIRHLPVVRRVLFRIVRGHFRAGHHARALFVSASYRRARL